MQTTIAIHFNVGGKTTMAVQTTNKAIGEAQIHQLVEDWVKAVRDKDINRLMSSYAPDILLFDIMPRYNIREPMLIETFGNSVFPVSRVRLTSRFATSASRSAMT